MSDSATRVVSGDVPARMLRYDEAAEILGVDPRSVYNYVKRGKLVMTKIGGSVRFAPADLENFIRRSKQGGWAADDES